MRKRIHINQHVIRRNKKTGSRDPVISCKTSKSNDYGNCIIIFDEDGREAARVVYSPDKPMSCGSVCWVETQNEVLIE